MKETNVMSATAPGPIAELIEHAARIIVASKRQPYTAPYHWAGALWQAGMLVPPGSGGLSAGDLPTGVETHAHTYGMRCPIIDCRWPVPGWDACVHPGEAPGDLPEGQQPKPGTDPRSEAGRRQSAIQTLISQRDRAIDDLEALRAEVARVRADVAEVIAQAIEDNVRHPDEDRQDRGGFSSFTGRMAYVAGHDKAAAIAREHAVAPTESVVEAPTGTQRRCRVVDPRYGQCELYDGHPTPDDDRHRTGSLRWPTPVGALPEDEGTRQEGLINVEE